MANGSRGRSHESALQVILASAVIAISAALIVTNYFGSGEVATEGQTAARLTQQRGGIAKTETKNTLANAGDSIIATANAADKPRYLDAAWNELHFKPAIDKATNEQCLSCHREILEHKVRKVSPAGVKAEDSLAWYQTLDTYAGEQATFHARHLTMPLANQVMNLKCNFCHQGQDHREEAPGSSATTVAVGNVTLRKQVNPSTSCLLCHGKFPAENMGLEGSWADLREGLESADTPNGCLTCHAEQFRTVRHQVNYLKADAIEALAKEGSSDVCYGCHGGRSWYMQSFPYPRHPWPGMDKEVPEWAKDRPAESQPQYRLSGK